MLHTKDCQHKATDSGNVDNHHKRPNDVVRVARLLRDGRGEGQSANESKQDLMVGEGGRNE